MSGVRVHLQGVGRFNRGTRLLGFDSIQHVSLLDPLDVPARIDELRLLKDGWLEGEGIAPAHDGLDWLSQVFDQRYSDEFPYPYLYPTETGGVRAEWSPERHGISLDIDLSTRSGAWHCLNMETDEVEERPLALDQSHDWQWLTDKVRQMNGSAA